MRISLPVIALGASMLLCSSSQIAGAASAADSKTVALVKVLKSEAPRKEKADACRELAVYGTPKAVPALTALLSDAELSHMARYALETMPGTAVNKALRESLGRITGRPLLGVIASLGVRRDARAVRPLAALLQDPDHEVARTAAKSLGDIATPAAASALSTAVPTAPADCRLAFCEGLLRCADSFAAKGKTRQASELYETLVRLHSPLHQVRTAALRGSVLMAGKSGTARLAEALRSADFGEFLAAIRISQEIKGPAVTETLLGELPTAPPDKQVVLLQALGKRGDPAALPGMLTAAQTCEKPVRIPAIRAIGELGLPSAASVLSDLMFQPDKEIAQAARESFAGIPGPEVDSIVVAWLSADDTAKHRMGLDLVARRRMTQALPLLFRDASQGGPEIRAAAFSRIGEMAGPDQVPALLDLLFKSSETTEIEGVEQALSAVCQRAPDPDACVATLSDATAKAQPAQMAALIRVIGALGTPSALAVVKRALEIPHPEVLSAAVRSLGNWSHPDAAPVLLAVARDSKNDTERTVLIRGYLRMAGYADVPETQRLTMCQQASALVQTTEQKKLLLGAVGGLSSMEGLSLAAAHIDDSEVKQEAGTAVLNIAERLLKGQNSAEVSERLVELLSKVAQAADSLADRANKLLEQARKR